jgi:hypothetical protein
VFVVDVSGSMEGFPLETSKALLRDLLQSLRPQDRFNLLFFAGGSYQLSERSLPASPASIARAIEVLGEQQGGGGTELLPALKRALAMPASEDMARTFVVVTDGFVTVEAEAYKLIVDNLGRANVFAFGIGSSVNRALIEGLARAGKAEPFVVENQAQAAAKAKQFRQMISAPVLTRIKVNAEGLGGYELDPVAVPDLFADRPVIVVGKYRGDGAVVVTGKTPAGEFRRELRAADAAPDPHNSALRMLWARGQLASLADLEAVGDPQAVEKLTALALRYGLLSKHTSFFAADTVARGAGEPPVITRQPLLLPAGMSDRSSVANTESLSDSELEALASNEMGESIVVTGAAILRRELPIVTPATESAPTTAERRLALSQQLRVSSRDSSAALAAPLLLQYGLTNALELRAGSTLVAYDGSRPSDHVSPPDLSLGIKWNPGLGRASIFADTRLDVDAASAEQLITRLLLGRDFILGSRFLLTLNGGLVLTTFDHRDLVAGPQLDASFGTFLGRELFLYGRGSAYLERDASLGSLGVGGFLPLDRFDLGAELAAGLTKDTDRVTGSLFFRYHFGR